MLYNHNIWRASTSPVKFVVERVGSQLVNGISYLSPLIGSDLHNLVEDTFQPHNSRSYCGVDLYQHPLYRDTTTNLHLHDTAHLRNFPQRDPVHNDESASDTEEGLATNSIRGLSLSKSSYVYSAFAVWNHQLSHLSHRSTIPSPPLDLQNSVRYTLQHSYSSIALRQLLSTLLQNGQLISCGTLMTIVNHHLTTSSSNTTSWFSHSLFSHHSTSHFPSPVQRPHIVKLMMKAFNMLHFEVNPGRPFHSSQNTEIKRLLTSVWAEFEIRKRCEMEMFVSYSEHQSDGGCLISLPSYHNNHQVTTDSHLKNPHSHVGYTSVSCHGRASSQFSIPTLCHGKLLTVSQLMKGIATAAGLLCHSFDILLLVAIIHCRMDIVRHTLLHLSGNGTTSTDVPPGENVSHFQHILNFCLSQECQEKQTSAVCVRDSETLESQLNEKDKKFLKRIGSAQCRTVQEIAVEIEKFLSPPLPSP